MPDEILSDRGSNFFSELMGKIERLLSLHQLTATPYHPKGDGWSENLTARWQPCSRECAPSSPRTGIGTCHHSCLLTGRCHVQTWGCCPSSWFTCKTARGDTEGDLGKREHGPRTKGHIPVCVRLTESPRRACKFAHGELKRSAERYYNLAAKKRSMKT